MWLSFVQIAISIALIILILLQERSTGTGGLLGMGAGEGEYYHTRRGLERTIFTGTIVLAALFVVFSLIRLLL